EPTTAEAPPEIEAAPNEPPVVQEDIAVAEAPAEEVPAAPTTAADSTEVQAELAAGEGTDTEPLAAEDGASDALSPEEAVAEEAGLEEPAPGELTVEAPRRIAQRTLPPGWFRATPQMMSLVGCSEPEMADVLRALGYRVHPPSDEHGPLYA